MGRIGRSLTLGLLLTLLPAFAMASPTNPYVQQLLSAIDSNNLPQLQQKLDAQAKSGISDLRTSDTPRLIAVTSCREFARYFGSITDPTPEQKETLTWLAA